MIATINNEPLNVVYTPKQDLIFNKHTNNYQFICVPKGRRAGGTNGAVNYVIEACCENTTHILWVDTVQSNLAPLYNRYFLPILKQLKTDFYHYNGSSHELQLFNSKVYFRSAERPQSLEGFAFNVIILNEAGIILRGQKGRNLWFNTIYPMVMDYASKVFFVGTPKGKKKRKGEQSETGNTLFYELSLKSKEIDSRWVTETISSYDNTFLNPENIAELENDVPFYIKNQEIYGEFLDRGSESCFHLEWFKTTQKTPDDFLIKRLILSLDTAFKTTDVSDYSCGTVIAETHSGMFYILDLFNKKLEFPELIQEVKDFVVKWPNLNYILIEDKASGQSLIQVLKRELNYSIKAIQVSNDKLSRAVACTPLFENNRVLLFEAPWNKELIDQLGEFSGNFDYADDIVDSISMGLNWLSGKYITSINASNVIRRKIKYESGTLVNY